MVSPCRRSSHGPDGTIAEQVSSWLEGERGQTPLDGAVPHGSIRTGEYAFKVPAGRQRIAVSLKLADDDGAATWAGWVAR